MLVSWCDIGFSLLPSNHEEWISRTARHERSNGEETARLFLNGGCRCLIKLQSPSCLYLIYKLK